MHHINNDTRIYIYDCIRECWIYKFDNYERLLWFLAKSVAGNLEFRHLTPYKTVYLNNINMGDDYKVWHESRYTSEGWIIKEHVEFRQYMFVDAYNRILDPRNDYKRILELANSEEMTRSRYLYRYWRVDDKHLPEFRNGPVPHTGVRGHGSCIRHPKVMNEKRYNSDPETMQFVRPSRRVHLLPDPWADEDWRPRNKSWKDCTKRPHQWKEKPSNDVAGFHFFRKLVILLLVMDIRYIQDIPLCPKFQMQ